MSHNKLDAMGPQGVYQPSCSWIKLMFKCVVVYALFYLRRRQCAFFLICCCVFPVIVMKTKQIITIFYTTTVGTAGLTNSWMSPGERCVSTLNYQWLIPGICFPLLSQILTSAPGVFYNGHYGTWYCVELIILHLFVAELHVSNCNYCNL